MAETVENVADTNTLKEFSETHPRASWSPTIFDKFKNEYNIYLHIDLHSIEGHGKTITAAKADAIRIYTGIVSSTKINNINNQMGGSENMMENGAPSNYLENTCHSADDSQPSDSSKNAESTLSSTETLDHIDQHFKNDRLRILQDFEKAYELLSYWSCIDLESSDNDSVKIALNIGDYRFEGCGHSLDEAKVDAIKKFYSSSVDNFFVISNENNETKTLGTVSGNTPSNDQGISSHCADTKPSDCCDNPAPIKESEEPDTSPSSPNHPNENSTAPCSFMETYNLRNNIWSPFHLLGKPPSAHKRFKVVLRIGSKIFQGQGFKKYNAQLNAVKQFKNNILFANKECKKTTFIENLRMIGKRPQHFSK